MYTHVSKCKNSKIKLRKKEYLGINVIIEAKDFYTKN
jgi:hypothetical protein